MCRGAPRFSRRLIRRGDEARRPLQNERGGGFPSSPDDAVDVPRSDGRARARARSARNLRGPTTSGTDGGVLAGSLHQSPSWSIASLPLPSQSSSSPPPRAPRTIAFREVLRPRIRSFTSPSARRRATRRADPTRRPGRRARAARRMRSVRRDARDAASSQASDTRSAPMTRAHRTPSAATVASARADRPAHRAPMRACAPVARPTSTAAARGARRASNRTAAGARHSRSPASSAIRPRTNVSTTPIARAAAPAARPATSIRTGSSGAARRAHASVISAWP